MIRTNALATLRSKDLSKGENELFLLGRLSTIRYQMLEPVLNPGEISWDQRNFRTAGQI